MSFEWPRHATGWHLSELQRFITKWGLYTADFDGCSFGMVSSTGELLRKQWRVVTSCPKLAQELQSHQCKHGNDFKHGIIQGGETARTASYPMPLCETIMSSWYPDKIFEHVPAMICHECAPETHREKEFIRRDFADIPMWSPEGILIEAMPGVDDDVPIDAGGDLRGEAKLKAEAKSLDHMTLHGPKNCACEFCLRGRMLSHYTHSKRPDDEEKPMPMEYGKLLGVDPIITSEECAGSAGEKAAIHVRDHYSGVSVSYPVANRSEDNIYKCLKHFGGPKLNGSTDTVVRSDNADEIVNAVHRMCWSTDPALANSWPHNSACERDIRTTKELTRPSHLQAGFWKKMWPTSIEYTSKARTFFENAPIYDYEVDKPEGEVKKNKTKYEVLHGHAFDGVKYPLGALVYYKSKADGIAEATTKPGIFAGWKLEAGLRYRQVVMILDYDQMRLRAHKHWEPKPIHQKEVFFPPVEHIEFPFQNAARIAINDVTDPLHEIRKEKYNKSIKEGVLPYEISIDSIPDDTKEPPVRHAPITVKRLISLRPTEGCPGCEKGTHQHNDECRARFDAAYGKKDKGGVVTSPPSAGSVPGSSSDPKEVVAEGMRPGLGAESIKFCRESFTDINDEDNMAMVTRLLERAETLANPKALEAIRKEANGLLSKGTWDIRTVMEKANLLSQAKSSNEKLHVGSLMTICSEKFAEMEEALRILKGRVVYRGDSAKDQDGTAAIYQNLTASPTSIAAANANIAYGRVPGHRISSADAVKAYVQADLKAKQPTWVQVPKELWEPGWEKRFSRPVCLLVKALYGHPESGSHWEAHLTAIVKSMGGEVIPEHPISFFFPKTGLLLTVYVDDFLLSGPSEAHDPFWTELSKQVEVEDIGGLDRFLGRYHDILTLDGEEVLSFNMKDYVLSACQLYEALPGSKPLRHAVTPFVAEGSLLSEDDHSRGALADDACKMLMKCLWAARLARPDILKPVIALARKVSCWSRNCDRMLYRLMCYMKSTYEYTLVGTVNDAPEDPHLRLYVDADFAGDREDSYSTSGGWLVLAGPRTYFPLTWVSKKQSSVSRSTTESEVVSLAYSLFKEALPMCSLWDKLLNRDMDLYILEDNKAAIQVCQNGFSSKLRHIGRTHKVNLQSVKDEIMRESTHLEYTITDKQAADIFTKALEPMKWPAALEMLGVVSPDRLKSSVSAAAAPGNQKIN